MAERVWPRAAIVTALAVVGLAGLGAALAPSWQRPALTTSYADLPELPPHHAPSGLDVQRTDYDVAVADGTRAATVLAPPDGGPHPAMVFVHGGGSGARADYLDRAERMARRGVAALVYDKRSAGYHLLRRDYHQLADDALAMVDTLRSHPGVDPDRVGLWGTSEGGWVVPLAAGRSDRVGHVVLANAPTMTPGEQLSWAIDDGLQRQGVPDGARRLVARTMALGDLDYVRHDPVPPLAAVHQPVLAYHATNHPGIPPVESARILADTLDAAGNRDYTIRFLGDGPAGGRADVVASWIHGLPELPAHRVAGVDPVQRYQAVGQPDGPATGTMVAGLVVLVVAGYLAGPAAGLVARWRGGAPTALPPPLRSRTRWTVAAGAGTMAGLHVALGAFAATSVLGGAAVVAPVAWLALRAGALATVVLAAVVGIGVWDRWRAGWRPAAPDRVRLAAVGVATVLVLLSAGYWELFALHW